ncbi:hypothetical protein MCO_00111 [Bartonella sp. DB5-6]|uniref:hypothetical protein n=1 Tax=Bartonella sp. DB5-6 TaxID=1094755 RepID=UPI00026E8C54|nr:hypothetical protein [Bartonella sp. DB5-6]EJF80597.1 hypothetical protein MCO_00111 [Bartonella sp. DB5-6]
MFKNHTLCILMTTVFCFLQIVEVNENFWRVRSQEGVLIAMVVQEKDISVQETNMIAVGILDKSAREKSESTTIRKEFKKAVTTTMTIFLRSFVLKTFRFLKIWVGEILSQAYGEWQVSLYH